MSCDCSQAPLSAPPARVSRPLSPRAVANMPEGEVLEVFGVGATAAMAACALVICIVSRFRLLTKVKVFPDAPWSVGPRCGAPAVARRPSKARRSAPVCGPLPPSLTRPARPPARPPAVASYAREAICLPGCPCPRVHALELEAYPSRFAPIWPNPRDNPLVRLGAAHAPVARHLYADATPHDRRLDVTCERPGTGEVRLRAVLSKGKRLVFELALYAADGSLLGPPEYIYCDWRQSGVLVVARPGDTFTMRPKNKKPGRLANVPYSILNHPLLLYAIVLANGFAICMLDYQNRASMTRVSHDFVRALVPDLVHDFFAW